QVNDFRIGDASLDPRSRLFECFWQFLAPFDGSRAALEAWFEAHRQALSPDTDPSLANFLGEAHRAGGASAQRWLETVAGEGYLDTSSVEPAAAMLLALVDGLALHMLVDPGRLGDQAAKRALTLAISSVVSTRVGTDEASVVNSGQDEFMPGMNLTREEAATRSATVAATSYEVALDLTVGESHFLSSTTVRFSALQGASTFVDLVDAQDLQISFNGAELDPRDVYVDSRIELTGLAESNELIVTARLPYSRTGEGLHRFVDPADDRVYLYSQFEVPDARRVYAAFEQPDLKS